MEPGRGPYLALRLGLRLASGLQQAQAEALLAHRGDRPFRSPEELHVRTGLPASTLARLAEADGFLGLGLSRRAALWAIRGLSDVTLPLFAAADQRDRPRPEAEEPQVDLPSMPGGGRWWRTTAASGCRCAGTQWPSCGTDLAARRHRRARRWRGLRSGKRVTAAGMVLVRQKPGSAKG
jgi:error-prone DNA polymerase